jgi:hypothetical protein
MQSRRSAEGRPYKPPHCRFEGWVRLAPQHWGRNNKDGEGFKTL